MVFLKFTLNNLNRFQNGILMIIFGILFVLYSKYIHKKYQNKGYKPFKSFRREGKDQIDDTMLVMLYWRSLVGIYMGYLIVLGGIISIISYFIK